MADHPKMSKPKADVLLEGGHSCSESAEEFLSQLMVRCFDAYTFLSLGLGSKLGLNDLMATFDEPKTSSEIAEAAGFKERYVREWLGAMVSGGIINIDENGEKYYLQEQRKAALSNRMVVAGSQGLFSVPQCHQELEKCFQLNGPSGIHHSSYHNIEESQKLFGLALCPVEKLESAFAMAPGLIQKLESGISVCDFGCGCGVLACHVAEKFPRSDITGLDIAGKAIAEARAEADNRYILNVAFKEQDVCNLPEEWSGKWDFIWMVDVAHDVPFTTKMLHEVFRVLTPGGVFIIKEVDVHSDHKANVDLLHARKVYTVSLFRCMPVSLSEEGGEGLGAGWGMEKVKDKLRDVGFKVIGQDKATFCCVKPE